MLLPDGTVNVYRNGALLGSAGVTSWPYYNAGGYIGLWTVNAAATVVDDFGGSQADVSFVAKEVFPLLRFLAFFGFDLAPMLGLPAHVWVVEFFALFLPALIHVRIHIRNVVNAINDLDRAKLDAARKSNRHDLLQHRLKRLQLASLEQSLAKDGKGRMIRRCLVHR